MRDVRLKVCGLRDNIGEVAALGPDYIGFIFYKKSPRYVGDDFTMPELDTDVKKVGVFVNESLEKVIALVSKHKLDLVQLHGAESQKLCGELQERGVGLIKAFPMDESFDFGQLKAFEKIVDYFLFDTKTKGYGGSGKVFNWEILKSYNLEKSYFLSGGLSLENFNDLKEIDLSKVHALDVNSKFEVEPGLKDLGMLKSLREKLNVLNQQQVTSD